jgi:hypothetical protein
MINEEEFRISIQTAESKVAEIVINLWLARGVSLQEMRDACRRLGERRPSSLITAVLDALCAASAEHQASTHRVTH